MVAPKDKYINWLVFVAFNYKNVIRVKELGSTSKDQDRTDDIFISMQIDLENL